MNRFEAHIGIQPQGLKMESESVANIHVSKDAEPFLVKSFGCGLCGEMFEIQKKFVEHCSNHKCSPPHDLFIELCCNSQHF